VTTTVAPFEAPAIDAGKIARAGGLAALLDASFVVVLYVLIQHRTTVYRIWQGVASALLGPSAFDGGGRTAAIGFGMHICIALAWATVWAVLLSRSAPLRRLVSTNGGVIVAGVLYGMVVWLMMNDVLIPFTHAKVTPMSSASFWVQFAWHPFGVGLPIVAISRTR
ncbi:MAG: hypothetical protein ABI442_15180, partial [Gemmatimonadaceae bacterium]